MRRLGLNGTRPCWRPARLWLSLAALAVGVVACGPDVPTLVTALPSLTATTGLAMVATPTPVPASPSPAASATASLTVAATPTLAASATSTRQPTATASATQSATAPASATVSGTPPTPGTPYTPWNGTLPTPDAQALARKVKLPILMYHYVEPWPAGVSALRKALTVQPADFAAEMAYLHAQSYVTVSLYDLMAALAFGQPLPTRAVVLTFDDGYRSLPDYALPAMQPFGYTGTVFVITQLMDENFAQYLTWPQAEALYAAGWKIEPHTKTHAVLAGQSRNYQLYEMLGSVQTVQAHIGTAPRFFAYPFGKWDAVTLELAREMNLWAAVTEIPGSVHDFANRYTLHRVRINGTLTLPDFMRTIKATQ